MSPREIIKRPLFFPLLAFILFILFSNYGKAPPMDPALLYQKMNFTGVIDEDPRIKNGIEKIRVKIGKNFVLLSVLTTEPFFREGDVIQFTAKLKEPFWYKNPGGFNYARYLDRQGIAATAFIEDPFSIRRISQKPLHFWKNRVLQIKKKTENLIASRGSLQAQGVLIALLWGEERLLDEPTWELFRNQGLTHLLVISGLHFSVVAWAIFYLIICLFKIYPPSFLHLPARKIASAGTFGILTAYFLFCDPSPSVMRAYIAISCYLIAIFINRSRDLLNILFLAAVIILLRQPADLFNLSFQFSFAAVLSLALIPPYLKSLVGKEGKVADFIRVNVAIFFGVTPLIVFYFDQMQWNGPFMNIWAIPAIEFLAVPLGLIALFFVPIFPALAGPLFSADLKLIEGILWILKQAAVWLPKPSLVFPPHVWELVLYYLLLILLVLAWPRWVKKTVFAILFIFILDAGHVIYGLNHFDKIRITHLDVGQGDSILVELPGPRRILIDTGGTYNFDTGKTIVLPFLLYERIPKLDALCITHAHIDHYGGGATLIANYPVHELWWNGVPNDAPSFQQFLKMARDQKLRIISLQEGMKAHVGEATFEVLGPSQPDKLDEDINHQSLVLKMEAGGKTALFTGDLGGGAELGLLDRYGRRLHVDYLKVGHHGSKTSSSLSFLKAVNSQLATVSAGFHSRFKHPNPLTLKRFQDLKIPLHRTDLEGAIEIEFTKEGIKEKSFMESFPKYGLSSRTGGLF